ncbi:MAG: leucine-rich repeat domain-containing protein [Firmicutes bacterium]|nr:leucine-rich repeat domain-containing protein [Bacillota bacterium]
MSKRLFVGDSGGWAFAVKFIKGLLIGKIALFSTMLFFGCGVGNGGYNNGGGYNGGGSGDNGGYYNNGNECGNYICDCDTKVVERQRLLAPSGLQVVGLYLVWARVENASKYKVYINGVMYGYKVYDCLGCASFNTSFVLPKFTAPRVYQLKVRALGDSDYFKDSYFSEPINHYVGTTVGLVYKAIKSNGYNTGIIGFEVFLGQVTSTNIIIAQYFWGKPVISIGKEAFAGSAVDSVLIPKGVTTIAVNAFYGVGNLVIKVLGRKSAPAGWLVGWNASNQVIWNYGVTLQVQYFASAGGAVIGCTTQTVQFSTNATKVKAVANEGYKFVKWCDGYLNSTRQDKDIRFDISVTAIFEKRTITLTHNFNNGFAQNTTKQNITIIFNQLANAQFALPYSNYHIFNGWYLDSAFLTKVADNQGNAVTHAEIIFTYGKANLYARWTVINQYTYTILMVFVTQINAVFTTADGTEIYVNYVMTDLEKQILELLVVNFSNFLNGMLYGLVNFEVSSFFTTEVITYENIRRSIGLNQDGSHFINHMLNIRDIPELSERVNNYQSTITTFGMNDWYSQLHRFAGMAGARHATVHLESLFRWFLFSGFPKEELLDPLSTRAQIQWNRTLYLYTHEFIHTIEQRIRHNLLELHEWESFYSQHISNDGFLTHQTLGLYLRYQATLDGVTVGIPTRYWRGEYVRVVFLPISSTGGFGGGSISVDRPRAYAVRGTVFTATATPLGANRFVKWSDGVTTSTRTVIAYKNTTLYAIFERI